MTFRPTNWAHPTIPRIPNHPYWPMPRSAFPSGPIQPFRGESYMYTLPLLPDIIVLNIVGDHPCNVTGDHGILGNYHTHPRILVNRRRPLRGLVPWHAREHTITWWNIVAWLPVTDNLQTARSQPRRLPLHYHGRSWYPRQSPKDTMGEYHIIAAGH